MRKLRINDGALKSLSTWKLGLLFVATTAGSLASFYAIGSLLMGWPGAKWALGVIGVTGVVLVVLVQKPFVRE